LCWVESYSSPLLATTTFLSLHPQPSEDLFPGISAEDLKPLQENSLQGFIANLKRNGRDVGKLEREDEADWAASGNARYAWIGERDNRKSLRISKEVSTSLLANWKLESALILVISISLRRVQSSRTWSRSTSFKACWTSTISQSLSLRLGSVSTYSRDGTGSEFGSEVRRPLAFDFAFLTEPLVRFLL